MEVTGPLGGGSSSQHTSTAAAAAAAVSVVTDSAAAAAAASTTDSAASATTAFVNQQGEDTAAAITTDIVNHEREDTAAAAATTDVVNRQGEEDYFRTGGEVGYREQAELGENSFVRAVGESLKLCGLRPSTIYHVSLEMSILVRDDLLESSR